MQLHGQGVWRSEPGYAMAALLVGLSVMAVLMSVALPQWSHLARREKEIELIWRGEQYARAIELFQRRFANAFPPNLDVLVEQRFLRRKYLDPITGEEFQPIVMGQPLAGQPAAPGMPPPRGGATGGAGGSIAGTIGQAQGPIVGVTSRSSEASIRRYNGRDRYNEWAFVYMPVTNQPGQGPQPGQMPGPLPPGSGTGPITSPPTGVRPPATLPPMPQPSPMRPPGGG